MNRKYINLFFTAILLFPVQIAYSQMSGYVQIPQPKREVWIDGVEVDAQGRYDTAQYSRAQDAIFRAIRDDVQNNRNNTAGNGSDGTVYMLRRNHIYLSGSTINYQFLDIHIKGEDGPGRMPLVLHYKPNNQNSAFMTTFQNTYLENFEFDAWNSDNSFANRAIVFNGLNSPTNPPRIIVKGIRVVSDRAGALCIEANANGIKIYVYDCIFGNVGHYISSGGNGRALDIRTNNDTGLVDTVVFKNNTCYNLTDRVVRSMGSIINYMEFDHNTFINNQGVHGSIQFGNTREGVVTNNLFVNPITMGDRLADNQRTEQTQQTDNNHPDKAFAIVAHNGTINRLFEVNTPPAPPFDWDNDIKRIVMRNNNIFFEQEFLTIFAANPTVFNPTIRPASDAVMKYLDGDPSKISFTERLPFDYNDSETGNLGKVSSYKDLLVVTQEFINDPTTAIFSQNWSLIYPHEWDVSYPTSSVSYTAADDGFPVGDLNWFPAKKSEWIAATARTGETSNEMHKGVEIVRCYPNPFVEETTIDYALSTDQTVVISVYNLLGQKVKTIRSGNLKQGTHQIRWDGTGDNGTSQPNGLYYIGISGASNQVSVKVVKSR